MTLTTHHHLVARLRISGAIPLLPLLAVMMLAGTTLRCHLTAPASNCTYWNMQPFQRELRHSAEPNGRQCTLYVTLHNQMAANVRCMSHYTTKWPPMYAVCHTTQPNGRHCTLYVTLHNQTVVSATSRTRKLPGSHPIHGPAISRLSTVFPPLNADVVKTGHGRCRYSVPRTAPHLTHLTHTHSRSHPPSRLP